MDSIIQGFLRNVNFYYYIVYPPDFLTEYHEWCARRSENRPLGLHWTCLLLMVCACSVQCADAEMTSVLELELGWPHKQLTDHYHDVARELYSAIPPTSLDSSPTASLLAVLHPLAYPALGPLGEPDADLGQKRLTIMQVTHGPDSSLTQDDINAPALTNLRDLSKGHRFVDSRLSWVKATRWTSVTDEDAFVANLVSLYVSWEHASCRIFDENYFIEQLLSGEGAYCSPLLINAILAVAKLNYKAIVPRRSSDLRARVESADGKDKAGFVEDAKGVFGNLLDWPDSIPLNYGQVARVVYFHAAVVELFDPYRHDDTTPGVLARYMADPSLAQLRRLLYIQRYQYGGPPQASTTTHQIRVLAVDLHERISQAGW
ncbi:hypothetical protein ACHAQA_010162 [Verticillium albo-atrum]